MGRYLNSFGVLSKEFPLTLTFPPTIQRDCPTKIVPQGERTDRVDRVKEQRGGKRVLAFAALLLLSLLLWAWPSTSPGDAPSLEYLWFNQTPQPHRTLFITMSYHAIPYHTMVSATVDATVGGIGLALQCIALPSYQSTALQCIALPSYQSTAFNLGLV